MLNFQIHLKVKQVIKIEECHERSIMHTHTQNKNLYKLSVVKGNALQQLQQHQLWQ
jgi:hypothetical protein